MPHVNIQYTSNLETEASLGALCRTLAEVIGAQRDSAGAPVYPMGGTRVLAYPAPHFAVADGAADRAFVFVHARIAKGRDAATIAATGAAMMAVVRQHFEEIFASRPIGITLQVDEGDPVVDLKHSNLHALFAAP